MNRWKVGLSSLFWGAAMGCADSGPAAVFGDQPGAPLPNVTQAELAMFAGGLAQFDRVFSAQEGIGPVFNENQCSACHTDPAPGGTGERLVLKASVFSEAATCDRLETRGGENVRSQSTPLLLAHGIDGEQPPEGATELGRFTTPFLFGLGLVDAIPEETIVARSDPDDRDGDGISGRLGRDGAGRIGRFGRKADAATLRDFVEGAARFEMGLTTEAHPNELGLSGAPLPEGTDPAPDPELNAATLEALTDYVRFLAPLPAVVPASPTERDSIRRGEQLFAEIGCPSCHAPTMTTGTNSSPALDRKVIALYSDLLLHDLGPALANVCSFGASPTETRTESLAGLRYRSIFLHDGRVSRVRDAILMHGGEAQEARDAFAALGLLTQQYVLRFLDTL